jgi:proteic killer suppression protein
VEVSFRTSRLMRLCESARELRRQHGQQCAKKVMTRLADLRTASTLAEFRQLPGRCHELGGARRGQLALELHGGKRLLFEPSVEPLPLKDDGGLDWSRVDAITVIEITDYHD